jgi:hypothetical protein
MDKQEAYSLIKLAISECYEPSEWTLILLKNSWVVTDLNLSGNYKANRHLLRLNDYVTIEITQYENRPLVQVYIGMSPNHLKRPKWISCLIDYNLGYDHIRTEVHTLMVSANLELNELQRGMNRVVTLKPYETYDATNQLAND